MGLNMLGEKKVRRLRELTGIENIDKAVTNSANQAGRWWEFRVIEDSAHWHGWLDRKEGDWGRYDSDDPDFRHWSTCADVPGGIPDPYLGPPQEPIATTGPLV